MSIELTRQLGGVIDLQLGNFLPDGREGEEGIIANVEM